MPRFVARDKGNIKSNVNFIFRQNVVVTPMTLCKVHFRVDFRFNLNLLSNFEKVSLLFAPLRWNEFWKYVFLSAIAVSTGLLVLRSYIFVGKFENKDEYLAANYFN